MGLVAGILVTILFSPPSPETVKAAVDAVYADGRIQKEIGPRRDATASPPTSGETPARDPSGRGGRAWRDGVRIPVSSRSRVEPWSVPAGLGTALAWGLGVVTLAVLALAVAQAVRNRRRPAASLPTPRVVPIASGRFEAPVGEADALAAAGRFVEAIHLLLLKTFATLVEATSTVLPPALTSREILDRVPLKPEARDALDGLVSAVEAGLFGGRPADRPAYDACVDRVRRFAAAYGRAAP